MALGPRPCSPAAVPGGHVTFLSETRLLTPRAGFRGCRLRVALEWEPDRCVRSTRISTQHAVRARWPRAIAGALTLQMCVMWTREEMTRGRPAPHGAESGGQTQSDIKRGCSLAMPSLEIRERHCGVGLFIVPVFQQFASH